MAVAKYVGVSLSIEIQGRLP